MKKFTKLVENVESTKYFRSRCEIDLTMKAANEGEASYITDLGLSSVKHQSGYVILSIDETTEDEYNTLTESYNISQGQENERELSDNEKVLNSWDAEFGDRMPTTTEKLEFYHQLRSIGIDGTLILDILKGKL